MSLTKSLKIQNCVIVANGLLPSFFSQHWFIKNQIFSEDELTSECIFTRDFVQVRSKRKVRLVVVPNQMQFIVDEGASLERGIEEILIPIIVRLGSFSYLAAGINFNWFVKDSDSNLPDLTKKLFKNDKLEITKFFDSSDASFGIYLSKDVLKSRLKLDIKPIKAVELGLNEQEEVILFAFNFHQDLAPLTLNQDELIECLKQSKAFAIESSKMMATLS